MTTAHSRLVKMNDECVRHGMSRAMRALAACVALALPAARLYAEEKIVFLRHAEKPAAGLGQLSCQGLRRSLALPDVLLGRFGSPNAIRPRPRGPEG